jgi:hypothetical protein
MSVSFGKPCTELEFRTTMELEFRTTMELEFRTTAELTLNSLEKNLCYLYDAMCILSNLFYLYIKFNALC